MKRRLFEGENEKWTTEGSAICLEVENFLDSVIRKHPDCLRRDLEVVFNSAVTTSILHALALERKKKTKK